MANQLLIDNLQVGCHDRRKWTCAPILILLIICTLLKLNQDGRLCGHIGGGGGGSGGDGWHIITISIENRLRKRVWRLLFIIFPCILWKYLFLFHYACEGWYLLDKENDKKRRPSSLWTRNMSIKLSAIYSGY